MRMFFRSMVIAASGLAAAATQAETLLTELPGLGISANSCYLSPCDQPGRYSAANVIDKLPYAQASGAHGWNAGDHGTPDDPNWLRLDFGASYLLSSLRLDFGDNLGSFQGYTNDYQLHISTDGSHWTQIAAGTLTDLTGNSEALSDSYSWSEMARPLARWLEYRVVGGTHWSELSEISVGGTLAVASVPEPAGAALTATGLLLIGLQARRRRRA